MPRFNANLTLLFNELDFLDRFKAAKDALVQVQTTYGDTPAGRLAAQRLEKMASENH